MSNRIYHVELTEGSKNTTPWGSRDRKGVKFPCTNPEHLAYYQGHGRYRVTSRVVKPPSAKAAEAGVASTVGKKGRSGPTPTVITQERLVALARMPVRVNMAKKRLLAIAADLGVAGINGRNPPSNAQLVKRIQERQAVVLAELDAPEDPDAGEGDSGEGEPSDD